MLMDAGQIQKRLDFTKGVILEAGSHLLKYFRSNSLKVEIKSNNTPVSQADKETEEIIRNKIQKAYPEDSILGEEEGETKGTSKYRWIIDPLDGTDPFVRGVPTFGVLIALEYESKIVVGACYIPALGELIYAGKGLGCWYQYDLHTKHPSQIAPAKVSSITDLADACFVFTATDAFSDINRFELLESLSKKCKKGRGWGDCYGYVLVATGRADIMIDPGVSIWDIAPFQAIIEEAGGRFTDLHGGTNLQAGGAIASNGGFSTLHSLCDN